MRRSRRSLVEPGEGHVRSGRVEMLDAVQRGPVGDLLTFLKKIFVDLPELSIPHCDILPST